MTDAERIARIEAELEQCRKSFAQERSQLENALARLRHQYTSDVGALNAALEAREKWKDAPRVLNPMPPNTTIEHRLDDRGAVPGSASPRIEHRVDICPDWEYNPAPTSDRSKCPACGVTLLTSDDGCSWCGPGAHR